MPDNDRYVIDILDVALNVIDVMASSEQESFSPAALARQFNINRSRMFRILKTLERRAFVEYDPKTETYKLGLKFLSLSENIRGRLNLRREAEDVLKNLAAETGDSAHLIVLNGNSAIVVDRYLGDNMLQVAAPIGEILPLHIGGSPKLLLAFLPDSERECILSEIELHPYTPNTITNLNALRKTLNEIRRVGYSVDEQDFEVGVYAFAAPVRDHNGNVIAGITITTPASRYSPERGEELIHIVVSAAQKLSKRLGYQLNSPFRN
jgi:DNA-binding IclR family transcriptional regulator